MLAVELFDAVNHTAKDRGHGVSGDRVAERRMLDFFGDEACHRTSDGLGDRADNERDRADDAFVGEGGCFGSSDPARDFGFDLLECRARESVLFEGHDFSVVR